MPRPNILFLMTDQQRADSVAPGGLCQTPNIDRILEGGVRFTRAYTPNAICSPARASMYTGVLPHNHGMVDCTHTVDEYRAKFDVSLPMWSRQLNAAGYRLGHFGKWHVERSNKLDNFGFHEYELDHAGYTDHRRKLGLGPAEDNCRFRVDIHQPGYRDWTLCGVYDEPAAGSRHAYVYDRGIDFIRRASRSAEPWCCVISTIEPHDPFLVTAEFYDHYAPDAIPLPETLDDTLDHRPNLYRRQQLVWHELTDEQIRQARACYYALCSSLDAQVGRTLDLLEELGQLDNTVIVYTTDHGELLGAHGLWLKGAAAFEEVYNIPLIIRAPGGKGGRCEAFANLMDLAPTLCELGGAEPMESCQGRSLVPLLHGECPAEWPDETYAEFHGQRHFYTQRIVWFDHYKYVFNGFDFDEFYDLAADPLEQRNLIDEPACAPLIEQAATRMWRRIRATGDHNLYNAQYPNFRFVPVGPEVA